MNLAAILAKQAADRPLNQAIIESTGSTTFGELNEAGKRAAAMLHAHGLREGDAVLIFQPMSAELYVALLAVFRLGGVAMFLDPASGRAHLEACCKLMQPKALIALDRAHLLRVQSSSLRSIPLKYSIGWPMPGAHRWTSRSRFPVREEMAIVDACNPALLTFTSGSTGQPKATVRTHGFLAAQHAVLARSIHLKPGEVDLATLPVFALANLASGVTSVIPDADLRRPGAIKAGPVFRQIQRHGVTRCAASPAFFERLLEGNDQSLGRLRKIFTGGAPVFPRLLAALQRAAPEARVEAVFGSTEAEPIAHIAASDATAADHAAMAGGKGLLAGTPVDEIRLRILSSQWGTPISPLTFEAFDAACLPAGQVGEIVVSGSHVLTGYLHGRGDEETKFHVGDKIWHRTGDAGWLDDQGRLWLMGRCVGRVQDEHGTVWPFAVECAALEDQELRRCALVSHLGKRILVVEADREVDTTSLPDRLLARLPWAHLDEVRIMVRIPVDARHNAKIDYPALRAMLEK